MIRRPHQALLVKHVLLSTICSVLAISLGAAVAQDYAIDWHTIDGGGEMWSAGGTYELGGTIGQPDVGAMTGGDYSLTGGFWALPPCWCMSDINNDGERDGLDVQGFVECSVSSGPSCYCADVDGIPGVDLSDVIVFVTHLIDGDACP